MLSDVCLIPNFSHMAGHGVVVPQVCLLTQQVKQLKMDNPFNKYIVRQLEFGGNVIRSQGKETNSLNYSRFKPLAALGSQFWLTWFDFQDDFTLCARADIIFNSRTFNDLTWRYPEILWFNQKPFTKSKPLVDALGDRLLHCFALLFIAEWNWFDSQISTKLETNAALELDQQLLDFFFRTLLTPEA